MWWSTLFAIVLGDSAGLVTRQRCGPLVWCGVKCCMSDEQETADDQAPAGGSESCHQPREKVVGFSAYDPWVSTGSPEAQETQLTLADSIVEQAIHSPA